MYKHSSMSPPRLWNDCEPENIRAHMICGYGNNLVGPEQYLVTLTLSCTEMTDAM